MAQTFDGKPCKQCGHTLRYTNTGNHCVTCRKRTSRAWKLSVRYGITTEEFNRLVASQNEKCAICDLAPAYIDHNHETGKVRGILCKDCNLMLGYAKDDVKILGNAIKYLIG